MKSFRNIAVVGILANPLLAQFAYVANGGSNNVSGYTINPATGALAAISGSPFPAGVNPSSVAVDPPAPARASGTWAACTISEKADAS